MIFPQDTAAKTNNTEVLSRLPSGRQVPVRNQRVNEAQILYNRSGTVLRLSFCYSSLVRFMILRSVHNVFYEYATRRDGILLLQNAKTMVQNEFIDDCFNSEPNGSFQSQPSYGKSCYINFLYRYYIENKNKINRFPIAFMNGQPTTVDNASHS